MEITKTILEMNKRLIIGLIALAVAFALSFGSASQGVSANEPYVVTGEDVSVSGLSHRGTILEDVKLHGGTKYKRCHWTNGGYNSGRSVNGGLYWYHDPVKAKICRNTNSPTGWVKVDGGKTGRNCGNPYKPHGRPPGPVVRGPVVMVRNFSNINMNATARASVNLKEDVVCPDGSTLSAQSTGLAVSRIKINQQMLMKARGNTENLEAQLRSSAKAKAIAQAKGKLEATCGTTEVKEKPEPEKPEKPEKEVVVVKKVVKEEEPEPVEPEPEGKAQPTKLPNTGPGAVAATFIGVSSLASFAYSVISRRLGL